MSDYESDYESDTNEEFILRKTYTLFLIDTTKYMENNNPSLLMLEKIFTTLKNSGILFKINTGILALGKYDPSESEVTTIVPLKSSITEKLDSLVSTKNYLDDELPLKEGIECATEMFAKIAKPRNDIKRIIFITNNPQPKFKNEDDALSSARLLTMNGVELVLLPTSKEHYAKMVSSSFYQLFFDQLGKNSCELFQHSMELFQYFCLQLTPKENTTKIKFYYSKDICFEMVQEKLFKIKAQTAPKVVEDPKDGTLKPFAYKGYSQEIIDDKNHEVDTSIFKSDDIDTESIMTTTFDDKEIKFQSKELKEITNRCFEPVRNGLYLLYVGKEMKYPIANETCKTYLIKANKNNKKLFNAFWRYCKEQNSVLYCQIFNKKRDTIILTPIVFKKQPCFIQYAIGYSDNFKNIRGAIPDEVPTFNTEEMLDGTNVMESIVYRLKSDGISFLDLRDLSRLIQDTLIEAKQKQAPYKEPSDHLSMKAIGIDKKIDELADDYLSSIEHVM